MFSSMQPSGGSCSSCWVATAQDRVGGDTSPCQAGFMLGETLGEREAPRHISGSPPPHPLPQQLRVYMLHAIRDGMCTSCVCHTVCYVRRVRSRFYLHVHVSHCIIHRGTRSQLEQLSTSKKVLLMTSCWRFARTFLRNDISAYHSQHPARLPA